MSPLSSFTFYSLMTSERTYLDINSFLYTVLSHSYCTIPRTISLWLITLYFHNELWIPFGYKRTQLKESVWYVCNVHVYSAFSLDFFTSWAPSAISPSTVWWQLKALLKQTTLFIPCSIPFILYYPLYYLSLINYPLFS